MKIIAESLKIIAESLKIIAELLKILHSVALGASYKASHWRWQNKKSARLKFYQLHIIIRGFTFSQLGVLHSVNQEFYFHSIKDFTYSQSGVLHSVNW